MPNEIGIFKRIDFTTGEVSIDGILFSQLLSRVRHLETLLASFSVPGALVYTDYDGTNKNASLTGVLLIDSIYSELTFDSVVFSEGQTFRFGNIGSNLVTISIGDINAKIFPKQFVKIVFHNSKFVLIDGV